LKFSLYVDDITISSSEPISNKIYKTINSQLNRVGLNLHTESKKKKYFQGKGIITGCTFLPNGNLDIPEDKKKEIRNLYNEIIAEPNEKKQKIFVGKLNYARKIVHNYGEKKYKSVAK
jgi:hypothetical protein